MPYKDCMNNVVFKVYSKSNFSSFNIENIQYSSKEIELSKQWINEGKSLVTGLIGEKTVLHCWISETEFDMGLNEYAKLPNKSIYVYKVFIDKNYRGLGLLSKLYVFIINEYSEKVNKCYIWISNINTASIKAHSNIGFKCSKNIISLQIKKIKFSFFTDFSQSA